MQRAAHSINEEDGVTEGDLSSSENEEDDEDDEDDAAGEDNGG
jgi:hypothetical protein